MSIIQCAKHRYATREAAERIMRDTFVSKHSQRFTLPKATRQQLNVYRCPACGRWHIGKNRYNGAGETGR